MLRHALAHFLHALANRIDTEPQVQYVYVQTTMPTTTTPPWQSPWYYGTTSTRGYTPSSGVEFAF